MGGPKGVMGWIDYNAPYEPRDILGQAHFTGLGLIGKDRHRRATSARPSLSHDGPRGSASALGCL